MRREARVPGRRVPCAWTASPAVPDKLECLLQRKIQARVAVRERALRSVKFSAETYL